MTMREIKFRGKQVDNGEWVYGYYQELVDSLGHFYWINEPNGDIADVIPETVGQYTGWKDRNGVESDLHEWEKVLLVAGLESLLGEGED